MSGLSGAAVVDFVLVGVVLIPLFLGWAVLWGASWMLPSIYRSSTLILVEQPTVPDKYVAPNVSGDLQDRLQSISQQILSRTNLIHIIEKQNLYPELRSQDLYC